MCTQDAFHSLPWRLFKFLDKSELTTYLLVKLLVCDLKYQIQVVNLKTQQVWEETLEDKNILERGKQYKSHVELDTPIKRTSFLKLLKDLINPDKPGLVCSLNEDSNQLSLEFSAKMNRFVVLSWIFDCQVLPRKESSALIYEQFILPTLLLAEEREERLQPQIKEIEDGTSNNEENSTDDQLSSSSKSEYHLLKNAFDMKPMNGYKVGTQTDFKLS
ncbi:hypothetical protein K7432_011195 [Basidiobolus ranarum]|uniref:Non-homologous end-joining factor 1 n=1 Tax=Basidiobolus ranarum TaxID=34480 RepID=A0ABR2VUN4_9FUNG